VATIYNSVDPKDWQINPQEVDDFRIKNNLLNKKIVLFGGRLSGPKGGEVILKAMALVFKKMPETILLIAGSTSKEFEKKMTELIAELKIDDKIKLLGWLSRTEIKKAFFTCDVCVTPSVYCDPFNLFNIEAAMAKKPVVGTCFGGTPEIVIDEQTGYIVNPQETEKLADKILELLKNPQKAKQFGEAGYERVKEYFVLDKQTEETLNWYQNFLK
jgi:glycosyltransferase involved in cell wall biosynthesis